MSRNKKCREIKKHEVKVVKEILLHCRMQMEEVQVYVINLPAGMFSLQCSTFPLQGYLGKCHPPVLSHGAHFQLLGT